MKKIAILFLALAMVMFMVAKSQAALVFNLDFGQNGTYDASYTFANINDTDMVDIYVSSVPAPGFGSIGFALTYDPIQLEASLVKMSPSFMGPPPTVSPGEIVMKGFSLMGLQGDKIKLGELQLKCIAAGISDISLYDSDKGGGFDDFVLLDGTIFDPITVGTLAKCENKGVGPPPAVPIPGTFMLLGCGLFGLVGLKRKIF